MQSDLTMTKEQILQELEFCIEGYSDFRDGKIGIGCFSNYVSALACVKREIEMGLVETEKKELILNEKVMTIKGYEKEYRSFISKYLSHDKDIQDFVKSIYEMTGMVFGV